MGIKINSDGDLNQYVFGVVEDYPSKNLLLDKGIDGSSTIEKILDKYSVILHEESDLTDEMDMALVDRTASDSV